MSDCSNHKKTDIEQAAEKYARENVDIKDEDRWRACFCDFKAGAVWHQSQQSEGEKVAQQKVEEIMKAAIDLKPPISDAENHNAIYNYLKRDFQSQQPKEAIEISVTGIVQKPSDAVEFAEWISRFGYGKGYGNERDTWFTFNDTVVANSTEKLYQLFKNNQ